MKRHMYYHGVLDFHTRISTKLIRNFYFAFLGSMTILGFITLQYMKEQSLPHHIAVGACMILAAIVSYLSAIHVIKHTRFTYFLMSTAITATPLSLLVTIFKDYLHQPGVWQATLWLVFTYGSFWLAYTLFWFFLLEPYEQYREIMQSLMEEQLQKLEAEKDS